jgi:hypothetical protein
MAHRPGSRSVSHISYFRDAAPAGAHPHNHHGSYCSHHPFSHRQPIGIHLKDGIYEVRTKDNKVAGFVIRRGVIEACSPVLKKNILFWMKVAKLVAKPVAQEHELLEIQQYE